MNENKKMRIAGWVLSGLVATFLIFGSAVGKFVEWEGKTEMFQHIGYSPELIMKIGVLEIILSLLFLIPRTGFIGAVLLTAYLGGATATHVRVGDQFFFPVLVGIVMWIAFALRRPEVFSFAFGSAASGRDAKPGTPVE
jgi:DoxX-like family